MKKLKIVLSVIFVLALMLGSLSCGTSNGEDVETPPSPTPTASVSPSAATPKPSATVKPSSTEKPTPAPSAAPTAEAAPTPTNTPAPTPTPGPAGNQPVPTPTPVPTPIPTPFTTPVPATPNPTQGPVKPADPTPTPHVHEWETTTIHHDAVTQEKVIPAHYEGSEWTVLVCRCGAEFTSYEAWEAHATAGGIDEHGGNSVDTRNDYHIVPEQTITEIVTPAWDETITKCRTCGAVQ